MIIALDQITNKKLVLAKQLYRRAVIDSTGQTSAINRIVSVIGFNIAIETVLKAIARALKTTKRLDKVTFHELIKEVDTLLNVASLPEESHIEHVHDIRNKAQHDAIYPSDEEVNECRTNARDFLDAIVLQVWGTSFEGINLADSIENTEIRRLMLDAHKQYDEQKYSNAVDFASEALDRAIQYIERSMMGHLPSYPQGIATTDHLEHIEKYLEKTDEDIRFRSGTHKSDEKALLKIFTKMRETLMYLTLEMNMSQLVRYRQIVGSTYFSGNNKHNRLDGKNPIEQADAEFVLAYCTDAIIRIETHVGALQKPFGIDWYLAG